MRRFLILSICLFTLSAQAQEVLLTVGNQQITAEEFKAVYLKNKDVGKAVDPKTPEEYLDLYIRFKLKIAEAYAQQRDTASKFIREFEGYRTQLAKPYLSDPGSEEALIKEAYDRLNQEVRAAHIMYALEANALPSDTAKVYNEMLSLRNQILKGKLTFENAARTKSADTWSAKQGGDLGYFTAFNMVYPFESGAYNQQVGEISMPVRSQFGYHLIKTTDKRTARGSVRVRQIFFAASEKSSEAEKQRAERSAREIYERLENGENFINLVSYSEDRRTKDKQGEMPEFGLNKMMPSFENAAFTLENPGDYSEPVRTNIGWHVIQLIEKIPTPDFSSLKKEIKAKVKRDSRSKLGAARFVKTLRKIHEFKVVEKNYKKTVALVDLDKFAKGQWEVPKVKTDRIVASFADQKITQSDVLQFWSINQTPSSRESAAEYLRLLFDVHSNDKLIAYEDSQLENKYPAFRNLVREYREGILLFDLTQEEVWDKAANDSLGIYEHYQTVKGNFTWGDRVSYKLWITNNEKDAKKISKWVAKEKTDKLNEFLKENEALAVAVSSGTGEKEDEDVFRVFWETKPGVYGPLAYESGFAVVQIIDFLPAGPKSLNEVKGLVIASYQNELERLWIASLQEKFEIQVNEDIKTKLFEELSK